MEHNTDRIIWTVLILAIGISLFAIFKPAANNLLNQVTEKIQTVANNVNSNPSDNLSSSSSSSSSNTNPKPNLNSTLNMPTSDSLETVPDSSDKLNGGIISNYSPNVFKVFGGTKFTMHAFIHNPTNHTVNLVMWTDTGGYSVGTGVPAHTDGVSTVTAYPIDRNGTTGYNAIRAYTDNAAISGVQYKWEDGEIIE